ncbi:Uma2 family endonuclease [Calothrix sp. CCY 0018]|uniref:Uma2 family endonuclease n=1 Tax=Calothrix sp. CCY 0018 TaxID=3103864 RepID=UPI0039C6F566
MISIPQSEPPLPPKETLPTMYDLPSEKDDFHFLQPLLLFLTFLPVNWNPEEVYSAADLNLYYDVRHPQWYKRPDWFGVVGVPKLYEGRDLRLSYVTWQEGVNPFVVVELLSPGTEEEDLGETESKANKPPTKWKVYEQILRIPYYIVFSRYTNQMQAFHLVGGHYQAVDITQGNVPIPELGLSLGLWQGSFRNIDRLWLRWFTLEGELIQVPEEEVKAAQRKIEKLAEKLRELGVNPDDLA